MVRKCCLSGLLEQHLPGCVRPKGRCADKIGWATRDQAIVSARRAEAAFGRMTPYRCTGCGAWHIGHPKTAAEGLEP